MTKELLKLLAPLGAVYRRSAPENAEFPFCILVKVYEQPNQDELDATAETAFGYQLDIYARTSGDAETVRDAAFALLNRPGEIFSLGDWRVGYCRVTGIDDNSDLEMNGSEQTVTRLTLEFKIKAIKE